MTDKPELITSITYTSDSVICRVDGAVLFSITNYANGRGPLIYVYKDELSVTEHLSPFIADHLVYLLERPER